MSQNALRLRPATKGDIHKIFYWRNQPAIRYGSPNPQPVSWQQHKLWYQQTLGNPGRQLYVACLHYQRIGVLRLDKIRSKEIEISLYLAPTCQGKGIGKRMIQLGIDTVRKQRSTEIIIAQTLASNHASHQAFQQVGFIESGSCFNQKTPGIVWHFIV